MTERHSSSSLIDTESGKVLRRNGFSVVLGIGSVLFVALVGSLDYVSGVNLRIYPLYYLPIAVGAYRISRTFGLVLAGLSTVFWVSAMHLGEAPWPFEIYLFNMHTQILSFALIAVLLANIAARLEAEKTLSRRDNLTALPNSRAFYEYAALLSLLAQRMTQHNWPITASVGAIAFCPAPETVEQAVHAADALMYQVKAAGKDRFLVESRAANEGG